jgi:hypothetical protein
MFEFTTKELFPAVCLSHLPLLSGCDEPKALSDQITLFGTISADVRHP